MGVEEREACFRFSRDSSGADEVATFERRVPVHASLAFEWKDRRLNECSQSFGTVAWAPQCKADILLSVGPV
jgi:hypothetical protein